MATYHAFSVISRTIQGLLEDACPRTEFEKAEFKLYHASDFERPIFERPIDEGITLLLYQVAVNYSLRNMPPRLAPDRTRYRASLPLDLHFLLTACAADPEKQQRCR